MQEALWVWGQGDVREREFGHFCFLCQERGRAVAPGCGEREQCRVDEQEEGMGEAPLGAGRGFCKEPREKFQAGFNAPRSPAELTSGRSAAEQQIRPGRRLCVAQSG